MKCLCGYYLVPILLLVCSGKASQLCLTSSSLDVEEGENITFSCTSTSSNDLMVVIWIQGNVRRCISEWNGNITITSTEQNPCEIASTSSQQHNVTLTMSSLDDTTAWSCSTGKNVSNSLTVNVKRHTTVSSNPQTTTQQGQESTYEEYSQTPTTDEQSEKTSSATMYASRTFNYIMIGSIGGLVTMSLVIVITVCGTSKKRKRQSKRLIIASTQSSSATGKTSDHEPEDRNDCPVDQGYRNPEDTNQAQISAPRGDYSNLHGDPQIDSHVYTDITEGARSQVAQKEGNYSTLHSDCQEYTHMYGVIDGRVQERFQAQMTPQQADYYNCGP